MSAERCPDCDAVGVACECASGGSGGGFEPLRIRPYVSLAPPGETDLQATQQIPPVPPMPPAQPVYGAVADPAHAHTHGHAHAEPGTGPQADATPAYGTPAVWPDAPPQASWPAETAPLTPVPQDLGELGTLRGRGGGGGGAPGKRSSSGSRRRRLPTVLAGAGTVVAVGTAALALGMLPRSAESDTVLLDAKPSGPAASVLPTDPTQVPSSAAPSPKASASKSAAPSKSASASPSGSRSSASGSPSPSAPRAASSSPAAPKAPTLRHGDSGAEVEKLQRLLAAQGLYRGKYTGKYDDRTENAVAWFQWQYDIEGDPEGVYGPQTRTVLEGLG
ncbi:peptidoglycan-binding protein [Streptomyces sp. NPDC059851]|uniref:peptidoglycan-binding domain-containing protein n=1 Tax=Streptomyces sp. NPDC059851 TaxID=3346971 RepID=UPI003654AD3B